MVGPQHWDWGMLGSRWEILPPLMWGTYHQTDPANLQTHSLSPQVSRDVRCSPAALPAGSERESHLAPGEGCRGQLAPWTEPCASWALGRDSCQLAPRPELRWLVQLLCVASVAALLVSFTGEFLTHARIPGPCVLTGHPTDGLVGKRLAKELAVSRPLLTCARPHVTAELLEHS